MFDIFSEAVFLGLSTGAYCAVSCAPVILPFLFSETGKVKNNIRYIIIFMFGRLIGYILIGALLGYTGNLVIESITPVLHKQITSAACIGIGFIMLVAGVLYLKPNSNICRAISKRFTPRTNAFFLGLLTGINFCPPFFAAAARVVSFGYALKGSMYFIFFYLGTSVFFMPLLGIPFIKKYMNEIRTVARITMIILGIYFILFQGVFGLIESFNIRTH
jgi:sulfite exporter TauE/SafE